MVISGFISCLAFYAARFVRIKQHGWTIISMKNDWKQILAFAVGTDGFTDTKEKTLSNHPALWVMAAAVAAPLLAEIPVGFRLPVVVLEVVLGILIGPHALGPL